MNFNEEMRAFLKLYCDNHMCEQCALHDDKKAWCEDYLIGEAPKEALEYSCNKLGWSLENGAVEHPSHYNQGKLECWDAMEAAFGKEAVMTFCKLNAFKYIWRADNKNGLEDIEKAINYLNKYNTMKSTEEVFGNENN